MQIKEIAEYINEAPTQLCVGVIGRAGAGKTTFSKALAKKIGYNAQHLDNAYFLPQKGTINDGFMLLDHLHQIDVLIVLDTPIFVAQNVYKKERPDKKFEFTISQYEDTVKRINTEYKGEILYFQTDWWVGTEFDYQQPDMVAWCNSWRCSASRLDALLTAPISTTDKEAGNLSKTAKTMLVEAYISKRYGLKRGGKNNYTEKGNIKEEDALLFIGDYLGVELPKNKERAYSEFFEGECDSIFFDKDGKKVIVDAKCSFTAFSFTDAKLKDKKEYITQMIVYCHLFRAKVAKICFCLLDSPQEVREAELRKIEYENRDKTAEYIAYLKDNTIRLHTPETYIPKGERLHIVNVDANAEFIEKAQIAVLKAREFLLEHHEKTEKSFLNFSINEKK